MGVAVVQRRWAAVAAPVVMALVVALLLSTTTCAGAQHVAMPPSSPAPAAGAGAGAAAPGPAGGGGMDAACLNSLLNMSDCLTYVQAGSAAARPDKACCPELAGLVGSNPVCLCELLSGAADSYGIAVDYSRALALPAICRVATPPVSTCAALGYNVHVGPSAAPMSGSPSMSPGISPSGEGPQFPGTSPFASPPASPNYAATRHSGAGDLIALAALPLAAFVAGLF